MKAPILSAREAFLYLILFTTLFLSAFFLGSVLFQLVNKAFPDPAASAFSARALRDSISLVIVTFPVFLLLTIRQARELRDPATPPFAAVPPSL